MFTDLASGLPFVQSGQLRALAVSTAERSTIVPDLPSMREAGVKDFDLNSWNGYFCPAGLPPELVAKLNSPINQLVPNPSFRNPLPVLGFYPFPPPPQSFSPFLSPPPPLLGSLFQ